MKILLALLFVVSCSSVKKTEVTKNDLTTQNFSQGFYGVKTTHKWVENAAYIANCVTMKKEFHKDVLDVASYAHYSGLNSLVVERLKSPKLAEVGTYYKRFTKARAYRNVGTNKVWINRAKISKADKYLINTLIHERLHVLGFGHKGNSKYKYNNVNSVPYKVGSLSEKYFGECNVR